MAVEDDVRRLSDMQGIFLGWSLSSDFYAWHEGRLQQNNRGGWLFRSISRDGTIVAFELGKVSSRWTSRSDGPSEGIAVEIALSSNTGVEPGGGGFGERGPMAYLRQQLPQEVTN
jgi:hypothetical protein